MANSTNLLDVFALPTDSTLSPEDRITIRCGLLGELNTKLNALIKNSDDTQNNIVSIQELLNKVDASELNLQDMTYNVEVDTDTKQTVSTKISFDNTQFVGLSNVTVVFDPEVLNLKEEIIELISSNTDIVTQALSDSGYIIDYSNITDSFGAKRIILKATLTEATKIISAQDCTSDGTTQVTLMPADFDENAIGFSKVTLELPPKDINQTIDIKLNNYSDEQLEDLQNTPNIYIVSSNSKKVVLKTKYPVTKHDITVTQKPTSNIIDTFTATFGDVINYKFNAEAPSQALIYTKKLDTTTDTYIPDWQEWLSSESYCYVEDYYTFGTVAPAVVTEADKKYIAPEDKFGADEITITVPTGFNYTINKPSVLVSESLNDTLALTFTDSDKYVQQVNIPKIQAVSHTISAEELAAAINNNEDTLTVNSGYFSNTEADLIKLYKDINIQLPKNIPVVAPGNTALACINHNIAVLPETSNSSNLVELNFKAADIIEPATEFYSSQAATSDSQTINHLYSNNYYINDYDFPELQLKLNTGAISGTVTIAKINPNISSNYTDNILFTYYVPGKRYNYINDETSSSKYREILDESDTIYTLTFDNELAGFDAPNPETTITIGSSTETLSAEQKKQLLTERLRYNSNFKSTRTTHFYAIFTPNTELVDYSNKLDLDSIDFQEINSMFSLKLKTDTYYTLSLDPNNPESVYTLQAVLPDVLKYNNVEYALKPAKFTNILGQYNFCNLTDDYAAFANSYITINDDSTLNLVIVENDDEVYNYKYTYVQKDNIIHCYNKANQTSLIFTMVNQIPMQVQGLNSVVSELPDAVFLQKPVMLDGIYTATEQVSDFATESDLTEHKNSFTITFENNKFYFYNNCSFETR